MTVVKQQIRVALKRTAIAFAWVLLFLLLVHWFTAGHDDIIDTRFQDPASPPASNN